jgi:chromate transporter
MGRTGVVGYGGGPSILPLIRHEAVTRYGWIDDEEFAEIVAIANTLPGPIATKMAAYLGYRLRKTMGAVVAVLAHILPTTLGMILLLGVLSAFRESPVVRGMIDVVNPVIAVMLGGMVYQFAAKAKKGLGWTLSIVFVAIAALLLIVFQISDAIVVLGFLAYGAVHLLVVRQTVQLWHHHWHDDHQEGA